MPNKRRTKNLISLFLVLILILSYGLIIYEIEYNILYERNVACLISYNNELCEYISQKSDFRDEYKQMQALYAYEILNMSVLVLENMESDALKKLDAETTAEDFTASSYRLNFNKEIISQKSKEDLTLTPSQIDILLKDGSFEYNDICYAAMDTDFGYLVISCPIDMSKYDDIDFKYTCSDYYYIYDSDTGEILESNIVSSDRINNIHDLDGIITSNTNVKKSDNSSIEQVIVDNVEYII